MTQRTNSDSGFTLVELITVMVIVGILAVSVLPRFFTVSTFQERGAADQVKSALRYGQKVAVAQHRVVSVTLSTAASANCGATLNAGNVVCAIETTFTGGPSVFFDALGRPVTDAGGATPVAANLSITVGSEPAITIEAETGYVH